METIKPYPAEFVYRSFLNFLWGMETKLAQFFWASFIFVFELPMRDGNFYDKLQLFTSESSFWTSYEGWKRKMLKSSIIEAVEFLNFLWGMETVKDN